MTLLILWLRTFNGYSELVVAADSRCSGGYKFDSVVKILPLQRGDCLIAYAGDTGYTYNLMVQAQLTVQNHFKSMSRALSISHVKGHLVRFFNDVVKDRGDFASKDLEEIDAEFILAGYCWEKKEFKIYRIFYDNSRKSFEFERQRYLFRGTEATAFMMCGESVEESTADLREVIRNKYKTHMKDARLDMEPLYILNNRINEDIWPTIGGNIQAYRVYEHLNSSPLPILKIREGKNSLYVFGRKLLPYERIQTSIWDFNQRKLLESWQYNPDIFKRY